MRSLYIGMALLALAGCSDGPYENTDARKICAERGLKVGTSAFDKCVSEETAGQQIDQLRQEREALRREQELYRSYRY